MAVIIAGIDTGKTGYIAVKDINRNPIITLYKIPLIGDIVDCKELQSILINHQVDYCLVEKAHSMPEQGRVSIFNFGCTYGLLQATVKLTTSLVIVHSKTWKGLVLKGTAKDKNAAIEFVNNLYPYLNVKNNHNKADAVCIAEYGYRTLIGGIE